MIDKEKSEKISKKIKALKEKTVENGCSENEAVAAAEKVQELLNTYNLSMSEVEFNASEFIKNELDTKKKKRDEMFLLVSAISDFTYTKGWTHTPYKGTLRYVFFGEKAGTETAHFLYDLLSLAIKNETEKYKKTEEFLSTRKTKTNPYGLASITLTTSFKKGMAQRLSTRLISMKTQKEKSNVSEYGIVLYDKMDIVKLKFADLNLDLGSHKQAKSNINAGAYMAGREAAENVNITVGIKAKGQTNQKRLT